MKEHDKNTSNKTIKGGDREYIWKRIQNNDSKDDPESWKQSGIEDRLETRIEKMQKNV